MNCSRSEVLVCGKVVEVQRGGVAMYSRNFLIISDLCCWHHHALNIRNCAFSRSEITRSRNAVMNT